MAFATEDFGWGKVSIQYNDLPAGNLHVVTVQIVNDSQKDISNIEFDFQVTPGSLVLRSEAALQGAIAPLRFAGGYAAFLAQASKRQLTPAELAAWGTRSDFIVPVLNRGAVLNARFLVSRSDHVAPVISVYSEHVGIRLRHEPPAVTFWGVNQGRAGLLGFIIGLAVLVVVVALNFATLSGAAVPWFFGAFGLVVGAAMMKLWRWVARIAR